MPFFISKNLCGTFMFSPLVSYAFLLFTLLFFLNFVLFFYFILLTYKKVYIINICNLMSLVVIIQPWNHQLSLAINLSIISKSFFPPCLLLCFILIHINFFILKHMFQLHQVALVLCPKLWIQFFLFFFKESSKMQL